MLGHHRVSPHPPFPQLYDPDTNLCSPGCKETKWTKVPCPRKQRDGRGLNPGVWGVYRSATHASTGLTEISISRFTYSGSRNGKIYLNNHWMKFLWYPHCYRHTEHTASLTLPSEIAMLVQFIHISQLSASRYVNCVGFPKLTVGSLATEKTDDEYNL